MPCMPMIVWETATILQRLWKKSTVDSKTNCWLWHGSNNGQGYGEIKLLQTKKFYVHRVSAKIYLNYDFLDKRQVNHKMICPNKNCWNPEHLYIGTQVENMRDVRDLGHVYISFMKIDPRE